ncbi:hypothetical protein L3X38_032211 [Prunus dulcis]|uniref:Retrotransposon gag domain-containing protein n=1 Tax=Prunus dulcis TaxID=3755 RepID=A0AAD4YVT6_PRUDU|nr:hypothetical protein L3X38_032211 [Prunus dulcis]
MPAQPPPPPFVKGAGENKLKTLPPWQEPELHEAEFQRIFYDQFYLRSYWETKRAESLKLRQDSMTVLEYEYKFNELSKVAVGQVIQIRFWKWEIWTQTNLELELKSTVRQYHNTGNSSQEGAKCWRSDSRTQRRHRPPRTLPRVCYLFFVIVHVFSIDLGATHSFVVRSFAPYASVRLKPISRGFSISLPTWDVLVANMVFKGSQVEVGEVVLEANLIPLDIVDLDVIRGMDWLARHHASIDYFQNELCFEVSLCLISTLTEKLLLRRGVQCKSFWMCFFDDLPRLPPSTTIAISNLPRK